MDSVPPRVMRFGVFEVDLEAHELRKRGLQVKLQDQPFRLLVALLENSGRVVTREELKRRLWPDEEYGEFDKSLNTAVQKIRQALDDSATHPRFVETVPRLGYRFLHAAASPTHATGPSAYPAGGGRQYWLLVAVLLTAFALSGGYWLRTAATGPIEGRNYQLSQLTHDAGLSFQPTLSSDGKWIAYASDRDSPGSLDIYVQQTSDGPAQRITSDPADDYQPHFAPAGDRIVFRSDRSNGGIYLVNTLGTEAPRLLTERAHDPRFSPDGRKVAFWRGRGGRFTSLHVIPTEGGAEIRLAGDLEGSALPLWTPDGNRVLFIGWDPWPQVVDWYSSTLDGSPPVRTGTFAKTDPLGLVPAAFHVGVHRPRPGAWLPGGRDLVFAARAGKDTRLWKIRMNSSYTQASGDPEPITFGAGRPADPETSTDGLIAYSQLDVRLDVMGVRIGKGPTEPTPLVRNVSQFSQVAVTRDGSKLAYISRRAGKRAVRVLNMDSGATTTLTETEEVDGGLFISADGELVAYEANSSVFSTPARGGPSKVVCRDCRDMDSWSSDHRTLLLGGEKLVMIERSSGERTTLVQDDVIKTGGARFSPDGRWILFFRTEDVDGRNDYSVRRSYVAPFDGRTLGSRESWIPLTNGDAFEGEGDWAVDGNAVYYWSFSKQASRILEQPLNSLTKRPVGDPRTVAKFTTYGQRYHGPGLQPQLTVSVKQVIFRLPDITGNIWLLSPADARSD